MAAEKTITIGVPISAHGKLTAHAKKTKRSLRTEIVEAINAHTKRKPATVKP